jgi:hypothetical protein
MAAVLVVVACSDDDSSSGLDIDTTSPPSTVPITSAVPTTPPEDPRITAAKADYENFWVMYQRLALKPDPNDPEIPLWTTGDWYVKTMDGAVQKRFEVIVEPGRKYEDRIMSTSIQGEMVTLQICLVDGATLRNIDTKETISDSTSTRLELVSLVFDEGRWKVDDFNNIFKKVPGEVPCESLL